MRECLRQARKADGAASPRCGSSALTTVIRGYRAIQMNHVGLSIGARRFAFKAANASLNIELLIRTESCAVIKGAVER